MISDNPHEYGLPFDDWRPLQKPTLEEIRDSSAPVVALQAQTGFGKSGVAAALAAIDGSALVFTKNHQLQEQYLGYGGALVKGRPNFICPQWDCKASEVESKDCSTKFHNRESCPYVKQILQGVDSRLAVTNYSYGLRVLRNTPLSHRPWLVLDEGHRLLTTMEDVYTSEWEDEVKRAKEKHILPPAPIPLWPSRLFVKRIMAYCDRVLVMSATLPDPELWASMYGVRQSDLLFLDVPNVWPDGSPVYFWPIAHVSKRTTEAGWDRLAEATQQVISKYPNSKGLIHPHSYEVLRQMKLRIKDPRILWGDAGNRGLAIRELFTSSDPVVLAVPEVHEGLDLPYELGFQCILKAPYPYLGSARVRQRKEEVPRWYYWETISAMVQAVGRMQRAPDDKGDTYVLDANALSLAEKYPSLWPAWVKRQSHVISSSRLA